MSNQTFVEPKSFMRVCDIPDASLFTTLFVLFGKHFFVGLVNRIGPCHGAFDHAIVCEVPMFKGKYMVQLLGETCDNRK